MLIVYKEPVKRPMEEAVADLLNRSLTLEIPQPSISVGSGDEYEVIGEPGLGIVLPPRPPCPRGICYFRFIIFFYLKHFFFFTI